MNDQHATTQIPIPFSRIVLIAAALLMLTLPLRAADLVTCPHQPYQ